jgi:hypothetical protein
MQELIEQLIYKFINKNISYIVFIICILGIKVVQSD